MNINSRKAFSKLGFCVGITTLVVYLVQSILSVVFYKYVPSIFNSSYLNFILIAISFYCIGFPLCSLLLKSLPDGEITEHRKFSLKEIIVLFLISYSLMIITNLLTIGFLYLVSAVKGSQTLNPLENVVSNSTIFGIFLFVGILSPIIEEILFRKVILNKLRCYGDKIAIIISALLFGLFHGNFSQFFYAFVLGLIFAYIALKSGTIKYTIILHMLINIMGSVVSTIASKNTASLSVYGIVILVFILSGLLLFTKHIKNISFSKGSIEIPKGSIFKTTCINPGMIFNFIIGFAAMFYILLK